MRENLYRFAFFLLVAFVLLICASQAFGQSLSVTPVVCLAPCEVKIELRVERDKTNAWWSISYSGAEEGESGGSLDENSETIQPVCTTNLRPCFRTLRSEGTYIFVGCVHRKIGGELKAFCTQKQVTVRGEWKQRTSVSSAKTPIALTSTSVVESARSFVTKFFIETCAKDAERCF